MNSHGNRELQWWKRKIALGNKLMFYTDLENQSNIDFERQTSQLNNELTSGYLRIIINRRNDLMKIIRIKRKLREVLEPTGDVYQSVKTYSP